ncbi:MAG: ABC transporter ATP-binding protein [Rhizobiaceae bacterium]|nr:ABC transporter ATP-binding protein [Rhizobiaceae bacterium]
MAIKTGKGDVETTSPFAIELQNVCKSFGRVQANRNISLAVENAAIHGIVGENGAGKSTLMNILFGLHSADSGSILIDGKPVEIRSSADAISLGIGMVHQHFMLVPNFTVLENIMLGREGDMLLKDGIASTMRELEELETEYGMQVNPHAKVEDLPVGTRQRIEIIKAIRGGARILILDEPTGVLTPQETDSLFAILRALRARGVTIILITHKLAEIMAITDSVSIIRDGKIVGSRETSKTNSGELAELMVGREVLLRVEKNAASTGETRLSVNGLGLSSNDGQPLLTEITFDLRAGEILGVAGVAGNGQSELMEVFAGMRTFDTGQMEILGDQIDSKHPKHPDSMRKTGLGHIPEDRHQHGLVLNFEASENLVFGFHHTELTGNGLLMDQKSIRSHAETMIERFDVRPANPDLPAKNFSGGNQQKLVIAREMNAEPKVLIVGQPTRGVDIGAIEFIHKQLVALRDKGCAILLVSVELDEILALSDRIMVMNEGRIVGVLDSADATERRIGLMMAGIAKEEAA